MFALTSNRTSSRVHNPDTEPDNSKIGQQEVNIRYFEQGAFGKGVLAKNCPKLTFECATILRTFERCTKRNTALLGKFGTQFATTLHNAPFANTPFSGFLTKVGFRGGVILVKNTKACIVDLFLTYFTPNTRNQLLTCFWPI